MLSRENEFLAPTFLPFQASLSPMLPQVPPGSSNPSSKMKISHQARKICSSTSIRPHRDRVAAHLTGHVVFHLASPLHPAFLVILIVITALFRPFLDHLMAVIFSFLILNSLTASTSQYLMVYLLYLYDNY